MAGYKVVSAAEMKNIPAADITIVDVRSPMEHQTQQLLRPHDLSPLDRIEPEDFMRRRGLDRDAPLYFLCRGGNRARQAAEKFVTAGFTNINVIDGGIVACESAGEPVSGGGAAAPVAGPIPLERQVRIAAGLLVAIGVLLGAFFHPVFYALSFFVGAGLVYSGVTDRCGMALVLTKAPWNKAAPACALKKPSADGGCS